MVFIFTATDALNYAAFDYNVVLAVVVAITFFIVSITILFVVVVAVFITVVLFVWL